MTLEDIDLWEVYDENVGDYEDWQFKEKLEARNKLPLYSRYRKVYDDLVKNPDKINTIRDIKELTYILLMAFGVNSEIKYPPEIMGFISKLQEHAFQVLPDTQKQKHETLWGLYQLFIDSKPLEQNFIDEQTFILAKFFFVLLFYTLYPLESIGSSKEKDWKLSVLTKQCSDPNMPVYKPVGLSTDMAMDFTNYRNGIKDPNGKTDVKNMEQYFGLEDLYDSPFSLVRPIFNNIEYNMRINYINDYVRKQNTPLCTKLNVDWQTSLDNLVFMGLDLGLDTEFERHLCCGYITNLLNYEMFMSLDKVNIENMNKDDLATKIQKNVDWLNYVDGVEKYTLARFKYTFNCETLNLNTDKTEIMNYLNKVVIINQKCKSILNDSDNEALKYNATKTNIIILLYGFRVRTIYYIDNVYFQPQPVPEETIQKYNDVMDFNRNHTFIYLYNKLKGDSECEVLFELAIKNKL